MTSWVGLGFVALLSAMGLVDLRHARRPVAKALGALAILAAGGLAGVSAWQTLTRSPLDAAWWPAAVAVAVALAVAADLLGELRTRSFPAAATVTLFAVLLPGSVGDEPSVGGLLFLAVICILIASLVGALSRRVVRMLWRDDDEDEEPAQGT